MSPERLGKDGFAGLAFFDVVTTMEQRDEYGLCS